MGLLQEEAGDFRSATESMLRTRALDEAAETLDTENQAFGTEDER